MRLCLSTSEWTVELVKFAPCLLIEVSLTPLARTCLLASAKSRTLRECELKLVPGCTFFYGPSLGPGDALI